MYIKIRRCVPSKGGNVRNVLRELAHSIPLRATYSEELSVALQRQWDDATRRAQERSGLRTAYRLPLYPSPTTCERERRRSLSPVPAAEQDGRFISTHCANLIQRTFNKRDWIILYQVFWLLNYTPSNIMSLGEIQNLCLLQKAMG